MVISCVAFGCQNRQIRNKLKVLENEIPIAFHRFPAKKDLFDQWIRIVKRSKWAPTRYSFICSEHFLISDYKVPPWESRPRLHTKAVPSVFPKFPKHLHSKIPMKRKTINSSDSTTQKQQKVETKSSASKNCPHPYDSEEPTHTFGNLENSVLLHENILQLKKKIKCLQQKVRRRDKKLKSLKDVINELKNRNFLTEQSADNLQDQFSGISREVFINQLKNKGTKPTGRRYSEEFKQFALTVNFYSHKAYNFLFFIYHTSLQLGNGHLLLIASLVFYQKCFRI